MLLCRYARYADSTPKGQSSSCDMDCSGLVQLAAACLCVPAPLHWTSCQPLLPRAVSQRVCAPTMSLKKGARMAMMVVNTTYMDRQTRM